jgi:pimeloyl-ACP methyl ester carboxylesterase
VAEPIFLAVNGVELCVEAFGSSADPALLLIAGASNSMDWWDTEFCEQLATGGRYVVRYDLRDTGASTNYSPGEPAYTIEDLVEDALQLIATLHLEPVHLVGISFCGGIAQQLGIRHPEIIASLTLISTSPGGPGNERNDLPKMNPELATAFSRLTHAPNWTDVESVGQYFIEFQRQLSGTIAVDESRIRRIVDNVIRRSTSMASASNHWMVAGGGEPRNRLADITSPTLVIHGTHDPLFPLGHGEALAREIHEAQLLLIEGMGHQYPPPSTWPVIIPAILRHTIR